MCLMVQSVSTNLIFISTNNINRKTPLTTCCRHPTPVTWAVYFCLPGSWRPSSGFLPRDRSSSRGPGLGDPRTVYPGGRPGTPTICGLHYDTLNADARVPGLQGCRCKQRHPGRWTLAMARPGSSQHRASHSPIRAVNLVFTSDRPGP